MVTRRDFVGGAGTTLLLTKVAFAQNVPAAGSTDASQTSRAGLVPPPHGGLGANHNYFIYSGGDPIKGLSVEIDFTEDFVAEAGFSIQLNGWSPTSAGCTWQQYCYGFYTEDKTKPQLSWSIQNWPSSEYIDHLHQTIGMKPGSLFNLHGQRVAVPGPGCKVPAGYKFKIVLVNDPKDASGAITGAAFSAIDSHGKIIIDERPLIRSYNFADTRTPIDPAALAPIITCQLNICARAGSVYGFMKSAAGTITHSATSPLSGLNRHPF